MNEENIAEVKPKKMVKKVILFIVLMVVIGIIVLVWRMQGPTHGVIKQSPAQTSSATAPSKEKIRVDGKYLSFAYLASYVSVDDKKVADDTEGKLAPVVPSTFLQSTFLVAYSAVSSKKIAVSVESLESGNLEDNASFKFRVSSPKLYTQSMVDIDGEKVALFTREEDMHEQTVFLKHKGLVVSVALSSSSADLTTMKEELLTVAKSIEWK